MYIVNGEIFDSFFAAIKAADAAKSMVVEAATGTVRWRPAESATKQAKHVLVGDDGSKRPFSKVRR